MTNLRMLVDVFLVNMHKPAASVDRANYILENNLCTYFQTFCVNTVSTDVDWPKPMFVIGKLPTTC